MRKFLLLILLTISFILTGCSNSSLLNISIDEIKEKMNNKESFIVYFTSENNKALENNLSDVLEENNLKGYKVDINKIKDEDENDFRLLIDYEDSSVVFVVNGIDSSKLSHITNNDITKKDIHKRLIDMNFIKERS